VSSVYIVQVYTTLVARSRLYYAPGFRKLRVYRSESDRAFRSLIAEDIRNARKHFGLNRQIVRQAALQRMESKQGYVTKDYQVDP
jgi:hypothetical protein